MTRACGNLTSLAWPNERIGEALGDVAARLGLPAGAAGAEFLSRGLAAGEAPSALTNERINRWLVTGGARLGLEAEAVDASYAEVDEFLGRAGPALLRLAGADSPGFLVLLSGTRRRLALLGPDHAVHELDHDAVRETLCAAVEAQKENEIGRLLEGAAIPARRQKRARRALLDQLLRHERIGGAWMLRPAGASSVRAQAREARLPGLFALLVGAHALYFLLFLISWWLLGRGALAGHLDHGWLVAWALMLVTIIPLRLLATYAGGVFSVRAGAFLKRRLLYGTFRLDPEEVRHQGVGQLLGRVMEAEVIEQMAITGGLLGITGVVELLGAAVVLALGAAGGLHVLLLVLWTAVTAVIGLRYFRRRQEWTTVRLAMTNDLVERMVGHRTRLAQERRSDWNRGEDEALDRYYGTSRSLDRITVVLQALVPRGWFIVGVVGLVPVFVGGGRSMGLVAVAVGGILLGYQAFRDLAEGFERLAGAAVAWKRIDPFWRAAARPELLGEAEYAAAAACAGAPAPQPAAALSPDRSPLVDAHDVGFRHRERAEPVLHDIKLRVHAGDRILLQGPSGAGKSTLGAILAGCRSPDAGLVLFRGLDRETLGSETWRRGIVAVPQFHENHVLMGTFAFNILMGRAWPPLPADMEATDRVCRALGLGPLLDRMPAGLLQLVGETGWQLSHGERSRLYMARALLQGADLTIFDESFAALDPETLRSTLDFVLKEAPTVLVIAHP